MARTYSSPLLNHICQVIRIKHLAPSTEKSYVTWIKRYIIYHGQEAPKGYGKPRIR